VESYVCNGGAYLMLLEKAADSWTVVASTVAWQT